MQSESAYGNRSEVLQHTKENIQLTHLLGYLKLFLIRENVSTFVVKTMYHRRGNK